MKKIIAMLLAVMLVIGLCACTVEQNDGNTVEITLWTYPIGGWGTQATVDALIDGFEAANPGIKVKVEYLTYTDGDDKVNTAIEGGQAPDLIMEGPERLVANWGAKGLMVDLSGMIDATDKSEINTAALNACYTADGKCYEYPLVMTAHCMAINKNVFEAAGAMEHINAETHTWKSVEDFFAAVEKVRVYTDKAVGAVFCGGQGGDQGTRALVTNLKGGTFTNAAHTEYTWNSAENIAALQALKDCAGIEFNPGIVGGDEIKLFYQGTLNMAFCWNIAQQLDPNTAGTGAEKTANGDEILFLAFPSDSTPALQGGIWGFGIFNNGNDEKIEAAKKFIKYMCDSEKTADAVKAANYFAVRNTAEGADLSNVWADNAVMQEYNKLMPMLGDYYQVTTNWAAARTAWWEMLQDVGEGKDIAEVVGQWANTANNK
ncbi:MAG: extracellular solute-binding protein [Ruminococcaceae bacterium]|nr:extracellular solute-binding protein [Oscillospiraceae bacterium]